MIIRRTHKFKLYPTETEAERFSAFAGSARFVYNLALEQRRDWWRQKKVDPAHTSQTCADCGSVSTANRESQARFECKDCGHSDNADVNASRNILRLSRSEPNARGAEPLGLAVKRETPKAARAAQEIPVL